jgi:hypothetical protein
VRTLAPVLAVATVPVLGFMAIHHERHANEQRLAEVASAIAARPVEVHCPGIIQRLVEVSPNSGSVYFDSDGRPGDFTELNAETCATLDDFAEGHTDSGEALRVARALHVLAHESFHLAGVRNEAEADCFGLQRTAFVARELGAEPAQAQRFAEVALVDRARVAPPEYRTAACYDGGPLDLDVDVWP